MNPVDIVLILCFIPAVISGLRKGFITQIAGIIIIIAGIWLSFEFSETVSAWISGWWAEFPDSRKDRDWQRPGWLCALPMRQT